MVIPLGRRRRRRLFRGGIVIAVAALALCGNPSIAFADGGGGADPKVVAAQTLFEQGRSFMQQKRFAEACALFAASQKLDPGAGTLLNLAACYVENGQTASAWITYKDAAVAAGVGGRHPDWVAEAKEQAAALEPKLSHLTITIAQAAPPGLVVRRDGIVVEASTFGVALPIDPGPHKIEATAPDHTSYATTIDIIGAGSGAGSGAGKEDKSVVIPALAKEKATGGGGGSSQVIVGAAIAGVGGVGIVVGSILGVVALGKKSDASNPQMCNADFTTCSPAGKELVDSSKSTGLASTVFLIGGGVFLVGGVALVLTAPPKDKNKEGSKEKTASAASAASPARAVRLSTGAPGTPLGITLGGSF